MLLFNAAYLWSDVFGYIWLRLLLWFTCFYSSSIYLWSRVHCSLMIDHYNWPQLYITDILTYWSNEIGVFQILLLFHYLPPAPTYFSNSLCLTFIPICQIFSIPPILHWLSLSNQAYSHSLFFADGSFKANFHISLTIILFGVVFSACRCRTHSLDSL